MFIVLHRLGEVFEDGRWERKRIPVAVDTECISAFSQAMPDEISDRNVPGDLPQTLVWLTNGAASALEVMESMWEIARLMGDLELLGQMPEPPPPDLDKLLEGSV